MPQNDHQASKRTLSSTGEFTANPPAPFVELGLATCFSFLRGASDAVDLTLMAWQLGYDRIGVADWNSLAGVVRLHVECETTKMRAVIGARLVLVTGEAFLAYPKDREAYARLSGLLTKGMRHGTDGAWQQKGICDLTLDDLASHADGIQLIAIPEGDPEDVARSLPRLLRRLPGLRHIAASYLYRGDDRARINRLDAIARAHGISILATNDVLYHSPDRRPLQDVMTCIREKVKIAEAGSLLAPNAERHLKSPEEMVHLFADWPHAITATREVADRCRFSLKELKYEYPHESQPEGRSPIAQLRHDTALGAADRYPQGVPEKVQAVLDKELDLIEKMEVARYILTIKSIVDFARYEAKPPILCQGRGSAANSAVCFCLGITAVDPDEHQVLFERFISEERKEPPDIDVDFEHERREEVIQHIYEKYGRHRAGLCATVIHYRPRSAIREVGKVMGLSEDVTTALAKTIWGSWGREIGEQNAREAGIDLTDPLIRRTMIVADQMIGLPRHLGQHVGGFILTERPLSETVPIGNGAMPDRSFIQWDKDDIDALGIFKVDVLALGMLTCIRKCFDLIEERYGLRHDLATIPPGDEATYDMLCKGDSLGVFQVESRAQMNMLPRLKPREFYDLVIEVAIVRPGPIQGDMVHPFLKRRRGAEKVEYPKPGPEHDPDELKNILSRTMGVPIFQEQAMKIALEAAQFSAAEANELRRAMATFRSRGTIELLQEKMVGRMVKRGYDPEFAQRCFDQIKGFGEYGFPESHAASFAKLVYVSSWLKCHYPDAFAAALLNSQPMGFYAPAQIVRDAAEHGVTVRDVDVNYSDWDCTLEPVAGQTRRVPPGDRGTGFALRLGLRQVGGVSEDHAKALIHAREAPYPSMADLQTRSGLRAPALRQLAAADAFRSMGLPRRQALWETRALHDAPDLPLFDAAQAQDEAPGPIVELPRMPQSEEVVADYQTLRLSLKAHPMSFLRRSMARQGYLSTEGLKTARNFQKVRMAGVVLIRQRPGSAKGVCFITIEDEMGVANLVIWPKVMEAYRPVVMASRLLQVEGYVQRDTELIHVVAQHMEDRSDALLRLSQDMVKPDIARADHVRNPLRAPSQRHPRNVRIMPNSRDFH
ncbi:error-prone DNA polymerase [Aestuariibius insulae]|uniref:error-prone DNA polymerase n=1 Tax=Aestuariibius insulae TaxID=2058287 RepID=UPI00345E82D8